MKLVFENPPRSKSKYVTVLDNSTSLKIKVTAGKKN
jgi:hypothetical protein